MLPKQFKAIFLLLFFITGFSNAFAQLESVADLGYIELYPPKQKLTFSLIYDNEQPAYVLLPGANETDPCFVPLKSMQQLRSYLKDVIKTAEGWTKSALDSMIQYDKRDIDLEGPEVWMFWKGEYEYNKDEIYDGWDTLSAEWEFFIDQDQRANTNIILSAKVTIPNDVDEFRDFELKMPMNLLKDILKQYFAQNYITRIINSIQRDKTINRVNKNILLKRNGGLN